MTGRLALLPPASEPVSPVPADTDGRRTESPRSVKWRYVWSGLCYPSRHYSNCPSLSVWDYSQGLMEKRVGIAEDRTGTYFPAQSPPRSEAGLVRRGAAPSDPAVWTETCVRREQFRVISHTLSYLIRSFMTHAHWTNRKRSHMTLHGPMRAKSRSCFSGNNDVKYFDGKNDEMLEMQIVK